MNQSHDLAVDPELEFNFTKQSAPTTLLPPSNINPQDRLEMFLMTFSNYRLASSINTYGYISEVVVGSVANTLALVVMLGLTSLPICNYMAALALADLSVVLGPGLIRWMLTQNHDPRSSSTTMCQFLNFQAYWSFSLSAWLLVAMTIDRYIAITYPLKALRWSTPKKARIVIVILMVTMIFINLHIFFTMGVVTSKATLQNMCIVYDSYKDFVENTWPWIDATVYSFLPFLCLIIFNTLIIRSHRKSVKIYSSLRGSVKSEMNISVARVNRRLTITLLAVSFTFVILTAPRIILTILRPTVFNFIQNPPVIDFQILANYTLTASLVNVLMIGNHCINFFLYILTGRKFRDQLLYIFKYPCQQRQKNRQVDPANFCSKENVNAHAAVSKTSTVSETLPGVTPSLFEPLDLLQPTALELPVHKQCVDELSVGKWMG